MADDDLDSVVRRADPDRWLASRFIADRLSRADVVALYAYDYELARAARAASSPLIAEIRLTWWREALEEIFQGKTIRRHPTAHRLAQAIKRHRLARSPLDAMIDARIEVLGKPRLNLGEAVRWADAVGGSAMLLSARILDPAARDESTRAAGRVWGLVLLGRAGVTDGPEIRSEIGRGLKDANRAARSLSAVAFPALAYATLARCDRMASPPWMLVKRVALLWAVLRGRL